jgi:stage II sporulation protein B
MKMDKPNKGNTITIKINRKDLPPKEQGDLTPEQRKIKDQPVSHLSENGEQETAAAKERIEEGETFDWILPTKKGATESKDNKIVSEKIEVAKSELKLPPFLNNKVNKWKKPKKGVVTPIFLAIFLAVLVGTTFGLTLLKMVLPEQVTNGEPPVVGTEQKNETPIVTGSVELTLPSLSASVVQEGVYGSQDSAKQTQTSLKEKGTPAEVFSVDGKFAIFIGVAQNIEAAKTLGQSFKASGMDTFSKGFNVEEKKVSNLQEEEKKLLELSPKLYQTLLASLSNGIPAEMKESFEQQSATLTKIDKSKIQNKEISNMYSELEAASTQLKKSDENLDPQTLNLVQQHLLSFLSSYQRL